MKSENQLIEVNCPVCGSEKAKHAFWTRDYLFKVTDAQFGVKRCLNCGTGYLSPRPNPEAMGAYYPNDFYWAWEGSKVKLDWADIIEKRRTQLNAKAAWFDGLKPGKLLDIGAQKGEFLWFMKEKGWDVEGVELDNDVPNPAQMPIRYGSFLSMDFGENKYDVITFWAVLEHVSEPAEFIKKATYLLKPGGVLIVLVTNFDSIQSRYYQADDYPRHLTLFSKKSVNMLCDSNGLLVNKTSTDQCVFGGTLNGGLIYLAKRILGYSTYDAMNEWKQLQEPDLFWSQWRGKNSFAIKFIAKFDRLLTIPVELLLDKLGYGFIFTFRATKLLNKD